MSRIAPSGWDEVRIHVDSVERLGSVGLAFKLSILIYMCAPFGLSLLFVLKLASADSTNEKLMAAYVSANLFLVLSALSAVLVVSIIVAFILKAIGVFNFKIDYLAGLNRLAVSVGVGAAIGTFAATLTPITSGLIGQFGDVELAVPRAALHPSVLIELPALAAVCGFFYGAVSSCYAVFAPVRNLLFRRVLPAVCIGLSMYATSFLGINPRGIAALNNTRVIGEKCLVDASDDRMVSSLINPANLILQSQSCGEPVLVSNAVFYTLIGVAVVVYGVASFLKDYIRSD